MVTPLVRPAGPHVRQDREQAEQHAPRLPEPHEAGHRRLAGGQRVALDLHVQEVLNGDAEHGRPEKPQADGRRHVGPDDVLARAHAKAREDDARPQDLAERQRLGHVPVRHRRQVAVANGIEEGGGCITRPDRGVAHGHVQYAQKRPSRKLGIVSDEPPARSSPIPSPP